MDVLLEAMRAYLNSHPLIRFAWQTIKSMVAVAAIFSLLAWVPEQPADRAWLFIYSLPLVFGAVLWFMIRLWRRHGGSAALSVIAALLVLSGVQYAFMRWDADVALRAIVDENRDLEEGISVVDLKDQLRSCDHQLCIEVLAKTGFDVLLKDGLTRMIRGEPCYAPAYERSRFLFLKAGYVAMCYGLANGPVPGRVLVIEDTYCRARENEEGVCAQLPNSFGGRVVTVRVGRQVIRRWLEGGIRPVNGWFALVGLDFVSVGKWGDNSDLLSRSLNVTIRGYGVNRESDVDQLLTELEDFLTRPDYADAALHAFWDVSYERGRDNQKTLTAHIERLIMNEDRNHIVAGLQLITPKSQVDVSHLRPRFIELSLSPDAWVREGANRALRQIARVSAK